MDCRRLPARAPIGYDRLMIRKYLGAATALFAVTLTVTVVVSADQVKAPAAAQHDHGQAATAARPAAYAMKAAPAGKLPPLPTVNFQPVEPMAKLTEVYEFAARHPEVLQYIPCYCGCEAVGHQANHDCFVKSRAANGAVTQWDEHGMGCTICLGVGRKAMNMFKAGMSVADIRAAIDREYGSHYPTHTPTPMPPAAKPKKG
jgi:hypothetical protein